MIWLWLKNLFQIDLALAFQAVSVPGEPNCLRCGHTWAEHIQGGCHIIRPDFRSCTCPAYDRPTEEADEPRS